MRPRALTAVAILVFAGLAALLAAAQKAASLPPAPLMGAATGESTGVLLVVLAALCLSVVISLWLWKHPR